MTRAATLRSLRDFFEEVADFRKARGQRYGLACYLTIAVAARMAGYRGVSAFAEFACLLDDSQKEAVGAFWSPGRERWTVPTESTFRYIFSNLKPDALDEALRDWALHVGGGGPVAMDGKDVRGANGTPTGLPGKPEMPAVRTRCRPRTHAPSPPSTIKTDVTSPPVHRQVSTFAETWAPC